MKCKSWQNKLYWENQFLYWSKSLKINISPKVKEEISSLPQHELPGTQSLPLPKVLPSENLFSTFRSSHLSSLLLGFWGFILNRGCYKNIRISLNPETLLGGVVPTSAQASMHILYKNCHSLPMRSVSNSSSPSILL